MEDAPPVHAEAALLEILTNDAEKASTPELRSLFSYNGHFFDDFRSLFVVSAYLLFWVLYFLYFFSLLSMVFWDGS